MEAVAAAAAGGGGGANPPSKKTLRELSGGNVLLEDLLSRIKFDGSVLPGERFSLVVEEPDTVSQRRLCFRFLWGYECLYGERCKFQHRPELQLRIYAGLRRGVVAATAGGHSPMLRVVSLAEGERRELPFPLHTVAYLQFDELVVWARDGGCHSRQLWEFFARRRVQKFAAAAAAADAAAQTLETLETTSSVVCRPCAVRTVPADVWTKILDWLTVQDARRVLAAFAASEAMRGVILDRAVWTPLTLKHFLEPRQTATRFAFLAQATVHAHAALVSSVRRFGEASDFRFAVPALREPPGLPAQTSADHGCSAAQSVQITVEKRISDIACTQSLVSVACVTELHLFRVCDSAASRELSFCKVGVARPRNRAFEFVAISAHPRNTVLTHAGSAGLFLADLDEATLPVKRTWKFPSAESGGNFRVRGLDISRDGSQIWLGLQRGGVQLVDTETMKPIGNCNKSLTGELERFRRIGNSDRRLICQDANGLLLVSGRDGSGAVRLLDVAGHQPGAGLRLTCLDALVDDETTIAVGTEDGNVLILDARREGVVDKLCLAANIPCMHLEISSRCVTAWGVENSVVKVWDVEAFSCLGEAPLTFDVTAVGHNSGASDAPFMLSFGASRPRKFNRGHASILCVATENHLGSAQRSSLAQARRKYSRGG